MPTDIYFAGQNMRVKVDEEPGEVAEAFTSARGLPFRLTTAGGHHDVYVNPAIVAFWLVSDPSRELESASGEESAQLKGREAVTYDIWGRPVRRKPRR